MAKLGSTDFDQEHQHDLMHAGTTLPKTTSPYSHKSRRLPTLPSTLTLAGGTTTSTRDCKTGQYHAWSHGSKSARFGVADGAVFLPHSFEGFSSGKGVKVAGGAAAAPSSSSSQTAAAVPAASKATAGESHTIRAEFRSDELYPHASHQDR